LIRRFKKYEICTPAKLITRRIFTKKFQKIKKIIKFTAACPNSQKAILASLVF
jgi:hypothetical protein